MSARRVFWFMLLLIALLGSAAAIFNSTSRSSGNSLPPEPYAPSLTLPPEIDTPPS